MTSEKRPPLGGYKDQTTSLHLTSELLAIVRAAATATPYNQSDIFRVAVQRYIENDLIPGFTSSQRNRYEIALQMEQQALGVGQTAEQPEPARPDPEDDFLANL